MLAIKGFLQRLTKISADEMFLFVMKHEMVQEEVFNLIREQLGRCEDGRGDSLGDYSTRSIVDFGKPTSSNPFLSGGGNDIRLYEFGDYYNSFSPAMLTAKIFAWRSDTLKEGLDGSITDLNDIYGNSIDDLQKESIVKLSNFILFFAQKFMRDYVERAKKG